MGIKFDILSNMFLLDEDSEFSKFFTSPEPIKLIHTELKTAHDTKLTLSPTNNRHVLWDAMRDGKAIFASINKPALFEEAKKKLKDAIASFKQFSIPKNKGRSYNEVMGAMRRLLEYSPENPITSLDFKKLKSKMESIVTIGMEINPDEHEVITSAIDGFLAAVKPGNYILVKRIPTKAHDSTRAEFLRPSEREFPTRNPKVITDKVFGQRYVAWFFDGDKLIDKKLFKVNTVTVFNELFSGWSTSRDFYVVENEQFLRTIRHPFVSSREVSFAEILPIEQSSIKVFTKEALTKYERLITNKVKETTDKLKQKMTADIDQLASHEDTTTSITEYQNAIRLMNQGIRNIDPVPLFKEFLLKDTQIELEDYLIIDADKPFKPFNPYSVGENPATTQTKEDWEISSKREGIEKIRQILKDISNIPTRTKVMVKVRPIDDPTKIQNVDFTEFKDKPEATQYELWDVDKRKWMQFNPKSLADFRGSGGTSTPEIAIAFKGIREYNAFTRRFVLYAMRSIVKTPEIKELETMLNSI